MVCTAWRYGINTRHRRSIDFASTTTTFCVVLSTSHHGVARLGCLSGTVWRASTRCVVGAAIASWVDCTRVVTHWFSNCCTAMLTGHHRWDSTGIQCYMLSQWSDRKEKRGSTGCTYLLCNSRLSNLVKLREYLFCKNFECYFVFSFKDFHE